MPMKQALELARRIESEPSLLDGIEDEITKKYLNEGASNGKIVLKSAEGIRGSVCKGGGWLCWVE